MKRPTEMEVLDDLPDEIVIQMAMDADNEYVAIRDVRNKLNAEVLRRFPDRMQWLCGDVLVEKVPVTGNYEWFPDELLKAFSGRVTKEQWADMVTEEEVPASIRRKVHTQAVLRYAKAMTDLTADEKAQAAVALVVRDLISDEHFAVLYGPWRQVMEGGRR